MSTRTKVVISALLGGVIGAAIGYKVAEKRLGDQFDERLEKEIAPMRTFYKSVDKKFDTPEDAVAALITEEFQIVSNTRDDQQKVAYHKIVKPYEPADENYAEGVEEEPERDELGEIIQGNVFEQQGKIQVISQAEFEQNESNWMQSTLTYYEKDNVLTDVRDDPIEDFVPIIGEAALQNFGKYSDDPNTVYVRNSTLELEYEVVRSMGAYAEEVLDEEMPVELARDRIRRGG